MRLLDAMAKRGYPVRQHLDEVGWTERKATVVDLDDDLRAALQQGGIDHLKTALKERGLWTFPALDIESPLPRRPDLFLAENGHSRTAVVAPAGDSHLPQLAADLVGAVEKRHGVRLALHDDSKVDLDLLTDGDVILVGGSHQNQLALKCALRYQTFFVDNSVPGDDGWVVTTHAGHDASGCNIVQITAPPEHKAKALECLLNGLVADGKRLLLRHTHRIEPGAVMRAQMPSWQTFAAALPERLPQLDGESVDVPGEIGALADLLAEGLDSGGVEKNYYNAAPIDIAVMCARYYQLTSDARALRLFRELLFRIADYYLKTPGGASYPADLDFRLGPLILCFARLEHEAIFDDDDRLLLANLLLACTRSVFEYTLEMWPVAPDAPTRHNHETFPARTLAYAADYFARFGVADAQEWRALAESVFNESLWGRYKQQENAYGYEPMVFEHGVSYFTFVNRDLDGQAEVCLRRVVERQIAVTDNFLRPVDYGDAHVSMHPVDPVLARVLATRVDEGVIPWFAAEGYGRNPGPGFLPEPIHDFPGLRLRRRDDPPAADGWERAPLEPLFVEENAPGFPLAHAFDKIAFRTGWGDDDHYLLFEGVGNMNVSHAHAEVNGIIRLNHLGRHWVVSNGYGRLAGMSNVAKSFSSRVRGPEDHNMLVLRRGGAIERELPVCSALLQCGSQGRVHYATGALLGYGGVNWFRTLILLAGRYVMVVDRVEVVGSGLEHAHVEWNCLGDPTEGKDGIRLQQDGAFMDVSSPSGWSFELKDADRSASWQRALAGSGYPHAEFPLRKLVFHMPQSAVGETRSLVTLLAATTSVPGYAIAQPEPGCVTVAGPHGAGEPTQISDGDLSVRVEPSKLTLLFASVPEVPADVRAWADQAEK